MGPRPLRLSILGLALAAFLSAAAVAHAEDRHGAVTVANVPLRLGCPAPGERVGLVGASFNDVVAAAERVLYRQIAHYQGRRERRSAVNTPVAAVVIELGFLNPPRLQGQRDLLVQAARLCGRQVANVSSAVMFTDGLNVVCCLPPITLFVVRTDRSLRVYYARPLPGADAAKGHS
jgi:hypothetical protein